MPLLCVCPAAPRYYQELKNRSLGKMFRVTVLAFGICAVIYSSVALCGYLMFGAGTSGTCNCGAGRGGGGGSCKRQAAHGQSPAAAPFVQVTSSTTSPTKTRLR